MKVPMINSMPFGEYTPENFSQHLRDIQAHDRAVKADRKARAKLKKEKYAVVKPSRAWSFRINRKGTPIISIRGRKPPYLTQDEFAELMSENPEHGAAITSSLTKRKIEIK